MNERDAMILELIRSNPFLSQQEMAEKMNMSRPALANLISTLTKQGKIVGRAYILPKENEVICIGGANIDRKLHMKGKVQLSTSNPATSTQSVGGVSRNIAENLGRLGHTVRLITSCGKDSDWQAIHDASEAFMNLSSVEHFQEATTGSYTAVMDTDGELILAMASMDVYDLLLPDIIMKHETLLANASCIVIDLNCPQQTVEYVQQFAAARKVPLAIVPVSSPKMNRMPSSLEGVTWFICNRDEAETLLKRSIQTEQDFLRAAREITARGVMNVVITAGSKGVYAATQQGEPTHYPAIKIEQIKDVTGAGDSFVGALLHAWLQQESFERCIQHGLVNAKQTLGSAYTVRPELSDQILKSELEEQTC